MWSSKEILGLIFQLRSTSGSIPTMATPITIRRGSTGADVVAWQNVLIKDPKPLSWRTSTGVPRTWPANWVWPITPDGSFGSYTQAATECWQSRRGLSADGVVGPMTWAKAGVEAPVPVDVPEPPPSASGPKMVPTVRTTPTMMQYAHALLLQWPEASKEQAGVLWAQFAIETGSGSSCWNWNLGNIKHVKGDGFDWMSLRGVWEIINGQRVEFPPDNPASWFRAYPDLDTAMEQHFVFLKKHFASSWSAIEAGSPEEFAHQLHVHGYYTAPEKDYVAGMKAHFSKWMKAAAFEDASASFIA